MSLRRGFRERLRLAAGLDKHRFLQFGPRLPKRQRPGITFGACDKGPGLVFLNCRSDALRCDAATVHPADTSEKPGVTLAPRVKPNRQVR